MTSADLWASVREYVEKQCPGLPQAKFDKVCVAVYEAMRFLVDREQKHRAAVGKSADTKL